MTSAGGRPSSTTPRRRERFVLCGSNLLTLRIAEALPGDASGEAEIIAFVPEGGGPYGTRLAALDGVRVVEGAADDATLLAVGVREATAVALVDREDVANIHTGLRIQELAPDTPLVIRLFNVALGERIQTLLPQATVLSVSATAAPAFVNAAIGRTTRQLVPFEDRTFVVGPRAEMAPDSVVCGLADTNRRDRASAQLLPRDEGRADQVLALAEGQHRRRRSDRLRAVVGAVDRTWTRLRGGLTRRLARTALGLLGLILVGTAAFAIFSRVSWGDAMYLTVLDTAGAAQPDTAASTVTQVVQALVTLVGIAIIPLVTAVVVDAAVSARFAGTTLRSRPRVDHVVVVGLGNVGLRVVEQLRARGVLVVGVDRDVDAPGVAQVRRIGVPVVAGDGTLEVTLRRAYVNSARALVAVSGDDVANLESGLIGRTIRPELTVVLRLRDDDLATRVDRTLDGTTSRSVSFLAAPAFATAMRDRQVVATVPIGRRVLLVADVVVGSGSLLAGLPAASATRAGAVRVVAVYRGAGLEVSWEMPPRPRRPLRPGDRLVIVATRRGLGQLLVRARRNPWV